VQIRIEASKLPGRTSGASPDFPGYENIHVGVQRRNRRDELLGLTAGDAGSAACVLDCDAVSRSSGTGFTGKYIQGRPHERFIYLSWGTIDDKGTFTMFRPAKLWLDAIDADVIARARRSGQLVARLGLTDARPLCAGVRRPLIEWSAG
jgi:hypothetical protein